MVAEKKSPKYSTWMQSQKLQNDLGLFSRQTIHHHSNTSLCPKHWCQRSWSWPVLWRPAIPSRTNIKKKKKKDFLCIIGDWNTNVGSWEIPRITGKFFSGVQNEAGQRLTKFCQDNTLVTENTLSKNLRGDSTRGHHQMSTSESDWWWSLQPKMENLYTVSKNKTWNWLLWLRSWAPYCKIQA